MMTSPIADLLTRLRNASAIGKRDVVVPASKFKKRLLEVLKNHNYIEDISETEEDGKKFLNVQLRYAGGTHKPAITHIELVSRPSVRRYVSREALPTVLQGYGMAVVSTSKGVMSDKQARKAGVGGEVIFKIW